MAQLLAQNFIQQYSDASGLLVGGKVYFYEAGSTTTKKAIYTTSGATVELSNPQTLGALGQLSNPIYLNGVYNIVITDSNDVQKFQFDNFDASTASRAVVDWMTEAQDAGAVIGGWSLVKAEAGITLATGDIVFGDSDGALYELTGDSDQDPEADSFNVNTGVGTDWIKLAIANAPITQSAIDTIQNEVDTLSANIDNRGYFSGLQISNGTDTDHDIDFAAGTAQDSTGEYRITAATGFTKAIDANWAAGTAQGGKPLGLTLSTNQTWYCFLIGKTTSVSSYDFGFDTDASATNLLNGSNAGALGFDIYRQVGYVMTDGSANIHNFIQSGNYFQWKTYTNDISVTGTSSLPTSRTNYAVRCPAGLVAEVNINLMLASGNGASTYCYGLVTNPDGTDTTPTETISNLIGKTTLINDGGSYTNQSNFKVKTNSSSEISMKFAYDVATATYLYGITQGYYYDPRDI